MFSEQCQRKGLVSATEFCASSVIGLDLSLSGTGITVLDMEGKVKNQRTFGYSLKKDSEGREQTERMIVIVGAIVDDLNRLGGDSPLVGIENMALGRRMGHISDSISSTVIPLSELRGAVRVQLWLGHHVDPVFVSATSARKEVLGRGNLVKDQIEVLLESKGLKFVDQNAMDAYVIAECVRRRYFKIDAGSSQLSLITKGVEKCRTKKRKKQS